MLSKQQSHTNYSTCKAGCVCYYLIALLSAMENSFQDIKQMFSDVITDLITRVILTTIKRK